MRRELFLAVAFLSVTVAAGCGASAGGGGTGAFSGTGGGGGGVGTGGGGGLLADTCDAATRELATGAPSALGFSSAGPWDSPSAGVIVDVTPTQIDLLVGATAVPVSFHFAGADLTQAFVKGAPVMVHEDRGFDAQKLYGWSYVAADRAAAVHRDDELSMYGTVLAAPPSPVGGPSIAFTPQCDYYEAMSECQTSIDTTVLAVTATLGGQSITVDAGQTVDVGGFQIHAGVSTRDVVVGATSCAIETGWSHTLSVLTPPAP